MKSNILTIVLASSLIVGNGYAQETGTTTGGPLIVVGLPIYAIFDDGVLGWQYHPGVTRSHEDS